MPAIRIVSEPPGPKARQVVEETTEVLSPSISRFYPLVVESAHDCIVKDVDGNQFIDFNSGIAVLNVGSTNEKVVRAASEQLSKFTHYSYTDFYYENINKLAEKLIDIYPRSPEERTERKDSKPRAQVFYGNSGTEAIEAAIKLARYATGRNRLIAYTGCFHGRTMGSLSLTSSKPAQVKGFSPLVPGVEHVPFPYCYRCPIKQEYPSCGLACIDYIEEQYFEKYVPPEEVAAFFIEPIQGEGGYVVPPDDYFRELFRRFKKYGMLFVADEVQSGVGRTGKWFAIEHFGVVPEMIALAKALCGGLPIGALVAKSEVMTWGPGSHASTFGGNPVSAAGGTATLSFIEENKLLENARKQGEYMMGIFKEWKERYEIVGDVRGKGLMIGIELVKDKESKAFGQREAQEIVTRTWKRGVLLITSGRSTLRIVPPLTITRELVDEALGVIEQSIREVNDETIKSPKHSAS
ncbi:MAG TPA: acetyl ornithine aminotransferase family protein [Nitrososphaerales archaeon]|nr:acetyl ornithine aminotransferase family protein [Nitrososphaerales archaeon]